MGDFDPHQFRDELTDDIHRRMRRRRDRFHRRRHSPVGGVIIGTAILLAGVLFLLEFPDYCTSTTSGITGR